MEGQDVRKSYKGNFKFRVVKEVLATDSNVTKVCKKYGIGSGVYYHWQEQFVESVLVGMENGRVGASQREKHRLEELEAKVKRLNEVVVELTAGNIDSTKKNLG